LDGAVDPSPFTSQVIENSHHTVTAPTSAKVLGIDYAFTSWSDGGAPAHTFVTSGDRTLVAGYHPVAPSPVPTEPSSSPPPAPTKKKKCRKHSKKSAAAAKAKCKKKKKH
jgi:hypothetical protein